MYNNKCEMISLGLFPLDAFTFALCCAVALVMQLLPACQPDVRAQFHLQATLQSVDHGSTAYALPARGVSLFSSLLPGKVSQFIAGLSNDVGYQAVEQVYTHIYIYMYVCKVMYIYIFVCI